MALHVEQVEALLEKNRARAARDQKRADDLEARNADTLQEVCTSLIVPTSAFSLSYARAYFGERAAIAGIPIDAGIGLILKGIAALFGLSVSKGGQRVGKFFHDIANGALASWTSGLGAEFGAKKRLETPMPAPAPQPNVGSTHAMPKAAPGPMTFEDLAAITAARQETPVVATPAPQPNVGTVGSAQETHKPASGPTIFENFAAMTTAMLMTPRAPQQPAPRAPQVSAPQAPQPARSATQAAPPPVPPKPPQPTPDAQRTPSATPQKPYRFTQPRAAPSPDLRSAFGSFGNLSMPNIDKDLQLLAKEYSSENLAAILKWATAPT